MEQEERQFQTAEVVFGMGFILSFLFFMISWDTS